MLDFSHGGISQVGKFGLVGVVNTLIDFVIFNVLTSKRIGIAKVPANIISTTVAMVFSFFANRQAVFSAGHNSPWLQALIFFAVTAFGLYALQTGILHLLINVWRWPRRFIKRSLDLLSLGRSISPEFGLKNSAKVVGTLASLTWNFFLYKYVVFR